MIFIPAIRIYVCALLICFLGFTACKKEEPVEITKSEIVPELLANYSFKVGSYWVYENDSLGIDTVKLMEISEGYTKLVSGGTQKNAYQVLMCYSTFNFQTFNYYLINNYIKYNGGGDFGEEGQPIYQLNQPQGHSWNGFTVGEKMDTLTVLNEIFSGVEVMHINAQEQVYNVFINDRDMYFAPQVGLIKFEDYIPSGSIIWNLKYYYIP